MGVPRCVDDGNAGMALPASYGDVPSGKRPGQLYVGENQVWSDFGAELQCALPALGLENVVALTLQYVHDHVANEIFVFDYQNLQIILPAGRFSLSGLAKLRNGEAS